MSRYESGNVTCRNRQVLTRLPGNPRWMPGCLGLLCCDLNIFISSSPAIGRVQILGIGELLKEEKKNIIN